MMHYAIYIWNRTPKKAIGMATPYKKCFGTKLDISNFHIFGSTVYVKQEVNSEKPGPQSQEGKRMGIDEESLSVIVLRFGKGRNEV